MRSRRAVDIVVAWTGAHTAGTRADVATVAVRQLMEAVVEADTFQWVEREATQRLYDGQIGPTRSTPVAR